MQTNQFVTTGISFFLLYEDSNSCLLDYSLPVDNNYESSLSAGDNISVVTQIFNKNWS